MYHTIPYHPYPRSPTLTKKNTHIHIDDTERTTNSFYTREYHYCLCTDDDDDGEFALPPFSTPNHTLLQPNIPKPKPSSSSSRSVCVSLQSPRSITSHHKKDGKCISMCGRVSRLCICIWYTYLGFMVPTLHRKCTERMNFNMECGEGLKRGRTKCS